MATPEDLGNFSPGASPEIPLTLGEDVYTLNWHNTLVRKFLTGEGQYDHLLHHLPDGQYLFLFLDSEDGIKLKEQLEEGLYPVRTDPILDKDTIEMYVNRQASLLESELGREFG